MLRTLAEVQTEIRHSDPSLALRLQDLCTRIGEFESAVVGFSGGVDSTLLAWVVHELLGERVLLVTAYSSTYPQLERDEAKQIAQMLGLTTRVIHTEEMKDPRFIDNSPDRCYYCKVALFGALCDIAKNESYAGVFEGGNLDDLDDYRPGRKAIAELEVSSPLCEARLTKHDIRRISAAAGLPTASKPSFACLASRFPYGEQISAEKLRRVEQAEEALRGLGFTQLRVRSHGDVARVELLANEMETGWHRREAIAYICKEAGFVFCAIDLRGYRTGSMNEVLP